MISSLRNRIAKSKSNTTSRETKSTTSHRYKKNTNNNTVTAQTTAKLENQSNNTSSSCNKENKKSESDRKMNPSTSKFNYPTFTNSSQNAQNHLGSPMNLLIKEDLNANRNETLATTSQGVHVTKQEVIVKESQEIGQIGRFADECEYRMNHSRRGVALIINNKKFDPRLEMPTREGTDRDAACLENCLTKLGFDVKLVHNCTASFMREQILKLSRADHSDMDCFVCVIMSHGEEGAIYAVDKSIELDSLINPFKLNRTLAGKPKLFFIQACRGSNFMEGIDSNPFEMQYVNKIPVEADFLIAYSTIAGYYSWRNSVNGSWFIQSLCEVFNEYGKQLEIMQLLTMVNRKVAYHYESSTNDPNANGKKQIPCIVSMLTKELHFKTKSSSIYNA